MNLFRKHLKRVFGKEQYKQYFLICSQAFSSGLFKKDDAFRNEIYADMYQHLEHESKEKIVEKLQDMVGVVEKAAGICGSFGFFMFFYFLANVVLIGLNLEYYVTCISIALIGACFIYKLLQFLSNRHCVLDAQLFLIYKSVLENLAKHMGSA